MNIPRNEKNFSSGSASGRTARINLEQKVKFYEKINIKQKGFVKKVSGSIRWCFSGGKGQELWPDSGFQRPGAGGDCWFLKPRQGITDTCFFTAFRRTQF